VVENEKEQKKGKLCSVLTTEKAPPRDRKYSSGDNHEKPAWMCKTSRMRRQWWHEFPDNYL